MDTSVSLCVYTIYTMRPMTTSGKELTLLLLHCTPSSSPLLYCPQPLGAIRASRLSTAAIRANPPSSFFCASCSSLSFLVVFRSRPQQQKNHRAPAGLSTLSTPPCLCLGEGQPHSEPPSFLASPSLQAQIYLAHFCLSVINR